MSAKDGKLGGVGGQAVGNRTGVENGSIKKRPIHTALYHVLGI